MELLALLFLYLITQNPDFPKKIQPVLEKLKSSEEALKFLKDLSAFSGSNAKEVKQEKPQSPTKGIADELIEKMLNEYLKR